MSVPPAKTGKDGAFDGITIDDSFLKNSNKTTGKTDLLNFLTNTSLDLITITMKTLMASVFDMSKLTLLTEEESKVLFLLLKSILISSKSSDITNYTNFISDCSKKNLINCVYSPAALTGATPPGSIGTADNVYLASDYYNTKISEQTNVSTAYNAMSAPTNYTNRSTISNDTKTIITKNLTIV